MKNAKADTFLQNLGQVLEEDLDQGALIQPLHKFQLWDSLALVSTVGLIDQCFGVSVKGDELFRCATIQDIMELVKVKASLLC